MALDLAVVMQDVAERHEGLVVKMLGDGVHFHFGDPTHAVHASLDFVELARARDLPPAHVGVEAGPMTYTDGDYYGLTVIIAARIASQAAPSEVLVGEGARAAARSDDVAFQDLGPLSLKGVMRPVRVYRAQRRTA
jgi:adenylate cyclase